MGTFLPINDDMTSLWQLPQILLLNSGIMKMFKLSLCSFAAGTEEVRSQHHTITPSCAAWESRWSGSTK